jgi:GTP pyrophosphokinase
MAPSVQDNPPKSTEQDAIVATVRHFLTTLPSSKAIQNALAEGEAISQIVAPLDLPTSLQATTLIYPLLRDAPPGLPDLAETPAAPLRAVASDLLQLGRFSLSDDWQPGEALATQQSETLRKMLLSIVSDPRLILVRIAEQLHRLRAAKSAPVAEQRRLAIETREIYAPLASRLGVWQLKWELEDLAFRYLEKSRYQLIAKSLNEKRAEREEFIDEICSELRAELSAEGIQAEVTGRPKHIYSIWRKMQRKEGGLEHIFDVRAVRIFVDDVAECYAALGLVHKLWPYLPGEFDDYIANPKENDYKSLHTAVIGPGGKTLEVQIRTHEMHHHAELGVAAHWRYKEGSASTGAFDRKIHFLRGLLQPSNGDVDLLEQIRDDVFEDRVYAVSPKGDAVELPANSTPLDFAYHVHTQIGHRCRGAKVNGRIVPLTYKIRNGDMIEIITGKQPKPSRDWLSPQLGYLGASRSRTKLRNWFRQQDKELNQKQGRDILDRELNRLNAKDVPLDDIARTMNVADAEALCIALGAGDLTSAGVARAVQKLRPKSLADEFRRPARARKKSSVSDQIVVHGVGDLMCNFARCCRPVPPELIVGYITQLRGVSIHRDDCGNFLHLNAVNPERVIEVSWGEASDAMYAASLALEAYDRGGLLRDISNVLADEKATVEGVNARTDKIRMLVLMDFSLSVKDLPALSRVISRLEQVPNVASVRRKR